MENTTMNRVILAGLLAASSLCNASYLVIANWTGKSESIHSESNRIMLRCEYLYAQKHLWRVFENHCEPLIILDYEKDILK